jgi:hypothetical protein
MQTCSLKVVHDLAMLSQTTCSSKADTCLTYSKSSALEQLKIDSFISSVNQISSIDPVDHIDKVEQFVDDPMRARVSRMYKGFSNTRLLSTRVTRPVDTSGHGSFGTPFNFACSRGYGEIVRTLLKRNLTIHH